MKTPPCGANAVATSQPAATEAALEMFAAGGNAVDAALAAAICLTVTEPTSNGIGSDAFALVWNEGSLYGYNGSGRSPRGLDAARFLGRPEMPRVGWDSVTVPGAVDTWRALHGRFGRLPFGDLFRPAIRCAREGFPVGPVTAASWAAMRARAAPGSAFARSFPAFVEHFFPDQFEPRAGAVFRSGAVARTLEEIAATGGESFYRGRLAQEISSAARDAGVALREVDLAEHMGDWVEPLSVDYSGYTVHELPPNGQGLSTLVALGLLENRAAQVPSGDTDAATHWLIEAMKIGLAEGAAHIADPGHMRVRAEALLDPAFLSRRARDIRGDVAGSVYATPPKAFGTVNLATADARGTMVSFIQSNFWGFGSGVVVPGTGISMQNRGYGFSTVPGHPNAVAPGKRPFHTIIPGFVTREGTPDMAFGLMGGHMQAQGHLQMARRILALGEHPQEACDAPRWQLREDFQLIFEEAYPGERIAALRRLGHPVAGRAPDIVFGGMQAVRRLPGGAYTAASDRRKDGYAAVC